MVAVIQADDTQAPSASDMMKLIKAIRSQHVGAIFLEPQYPDKVAATLSRETGVATAKLDPVATGPAIAHRWTITKKPCAPTCTRWRHPWNQLTPSSSATYPCAGRARHP